MVRRLIDGDLPRALLPWFHQTKDRGRTLEDQWKTLDQVTFKGLREGEKAGWRPSLILSPMIVETGRRLLFSNLDLYGLTDIQARKRKTVSIEQEDLDPLPDEGGIGDSRGRPSSSSGASRRSTGASRSRSRCG